jgi:excisionase family DNA binding protein
MQEFISSNTVSDESATENSRLLTGGEVSMQLRICRHTLRRWEQAGKIKGIRLGRRVIRFRLADVKRLIEEAA